VGPEALVLHVEESATIEGVLLNCCQVHNLGLQIRFSAAKLTVSKEELSHPLLLRAIGEHAPNAERQVRLHIVVAAKTGLTGIAPKHLSLKTSQLQTDLLGDGEFVHTNNTVDCLCVKKSVLDRICRDLLRAAEETLAEDKLGITTAKRLVEARFAAQSLGVRY
jgi:hypothetical protein